MIQWHKYYFTFDSFTSKHSESAWKTGPNTYKSHLNRHQVQMSKCRLKTSESITEQNNVFLYIFLKYQAKMANLNLYSYKMASMKVSEG